jgi:hypothetical protein
VSQGADFELALSKFCPLAHAPEALLSPCLLGSALGHESLSFVLASQLHLERPLDLAQDLLVRNSLGLLILSHYLGLLLDLGSQLLLGPTLGLATLLDQLAHSQVNLKLIKD